MLNVLYLYNATQTYTNTVFEHITSFEKYSAHRSFFCHQDASSDFNIDLSRFDAICIHFSIRLPFNQISKSTADAFEAFKGLKFLFIQDEYDHTHRAWNWIKSLGIQLVFTVVPEAGVQHIYPAREFPATRFISNITGYVPCDLDLNTEVVPTSRRSLLIGYRGRSLPIRYGQLGLEKIGIGRIVKSYCDAHGFHTDIAWTEESRIYGPRWYSFMASCRSMLGSESGSNVFDLDGTLVERIKQFRKQNTKVTDELVYEKFVRAEEIVGLMNQVSPRIFEAIAAKTVLVLFEGKYSGVVKAGEHFISVKKDGSNLAEVMRLLQDGVYVDAMAERAYQDVIASGRYSYQSFVAMVDEQIALAFKELELLKGRLDGAHLPVSNLSEPLPITTSPIRAVPSRASGKTVFGRFAFYIWLKLHVTIRRSLAPPLKRILGRE